ncbi:alpha/beta hydrolase [Virgibacillus oceani]|uniref:Alpha/beta hydrolase n=1 Tax=Virgibacillus oceani TaxID=1479511 RepID=A0A917H3Z6_9BACI|nr:alpha/beta hydrolase [Virgibacillus oceani]GGG66895.1 alpha/beta hydrolase [Virgibacillus oceani]
MENEYWLRMSDDADIYVKKWFEPNRKPKAILQLAHGMVEHIERYNDFASFLIKHDIFVYGNDHRGHGKTGERQGLLGFLAEKDGFQIVTEDLFEVTKKIKSDFPNIPVFMLGHSMGSFLGRNYIQSHSNEIDGILLSGTGYFPKIKTFTGKQLSSLFPPRNPNTLMNFLTYFSYNKKIGNRKTTLDWLTSNEKAVQDYMNDPYCGFVPTARFFYDLMSGIINIQDSNRIETIRKDLPLLLISGDMDPVGDYTKGVWKTAKLYEKAGMEKIMIHIFTDGRHELLNETYKDEVYHSIYNWIVNEINRKSSE